MYVNHVGLGRPHGAPHPARAGECSTGAAILRSADISYPNAVPNLVAKPISHKQGHVAEATLLKGRALLQQNPGIVPAVNNGDVR
jgi:hypothetical protein